jgi:hypothetical protein
MSQMGHFQPRQPRLASGLMSAAGLIAAVRSTDAGSSVSATSGCEQPQQQVSLFDHLVGQREQLVGHGDAQRPGGVEVDN